MHGVHFLQKCKRNSLAAANFSDIELEDDEKDPAAHNVVAQDNRDDEEHKIVRMNVPFALPGQGVRGTYFIGYARYWDVTKTMLTNMFTQNDKIA